MDDDRIPTAGAAYGYAWGVLSTRFPELLLAALAWIACAAPSVLLHHAKAGMPALLYDTLVMVPLNFGALYVYLRAARGQGVGLEHLFAPFGERYPQILITHVLFVVLVGAGLVALVVPGVWIASRLAFVAFLVMDEGYAGTEAITESWERTRGYAGRILGVLLLGVPIALAGLLLFGVGLVPAVMWIDLAFASLYVAVTASDAPPVAHRDGEPTAVGDAP